MEFQVLGTVEAWSDGVRIDIGSRKQRFVLAVLLLEANRLVPLARLIDLIWPQEPPVSARSTVQALISRLRTAFRGAGVDDAVLLNQGAGYLLRVDPLSVDVHRFADLMAKARMADDEHGVVMLAEALRLWRGEPLADVASQDVRERLCANLFELRWTALEYWADAQLRLGRPKQVLAGLTELVTEHPERQRLVGQLMLAFYREGRANDALDTYRRLRTWLSDEFGLDPGPELRQLELAILRADPSLDVPEEAARAEPMRPAELPHDVRGFVGRARELARLDADTHALSSCTKIWVVSGTAGVGKTALAVHWGHRSRGAFPDGQLYVDLRGFDAEHDPLAPCAALAQLLRGLGADPRLIPSDLDSQAKLYRSLLADKHVLLILDNARDTGQVSALIPPAGTVVITSRQRLGGLIALTGARALPLDVLSAADSIRLLETVLGVSHVAAERPAAEDLARLCGYLPLALRIAGANVHLWPESDIASLARELAQGDPLAGLTLDGAEESAVTTAFALSYRALSTNQRRMFRRLGLIPGPSFTAQSAGAAADMTVAEANRHLTGLASSHLVERYASGRYRFHDLLRRYALERAVAEESEADRERARERLYGYYLEAADAAGRRLFPYFVRLPRDMSSEQRTFSYEEALAWLDAEWPNLTAAVNQTAIQGPRRFSWQIVDALRAYFHIRGRSTEWLSAASTALDVARAAGDERAQAAMRQSIAHVSVYRGRYDVAREHLVSALDGNLAGDWSEGQAVLLTSLSFVHQRLGDLPEAFACGRRAFTLSKEKGFGFATVMSLTNLGAVYTQLGAMRRACEQFTQALELSERIGAHHSVALLLAESGNAYRTLGKYPASEELFAKALAANRELDYWYGEAAALSGRALLRCETGLTEQAYLDATSAVKLTRQAGDFGAEAWALTVLGRVCLQLDLPAEAVNHHRRALDIARETGFRWCEATALAEVAESLLHLDDLDGAQFHGEMAIDLSRGSRYRPIEASALATVAVVHLRLGDCELAAEMGGRALKLAKYIGHPAGHARATRLLAETAATRRDAFTAKACETAGRAAL